MLHYGPVWASSEQNKRNLTIIKTLTLKILLPSIVFHDQIYIFMMIFMALSYLLLIYGLFFLRGGNVS